jgi:hypothetical protein
MHSFRDREKLKDIEKEHFLFQGPPEYTQIGIFGMKIFVPSGNPALRGIYMDYEMPRDTVRHSLD